MVMDTDMDVQTDVVIIKAMGGVQEKATWTTAIITAMVIIISMNWDMRMEEDMPIAEVTEMVAEMVVDTEIEQEMEWEMAGIVEVGMQMA